MQQRSTAQSLYHGVYQSDGRMVVTVPAALASSTVAVYFPVGLCDPKTCDLAMYDQVLLQLSQVPTDVSVTSIPEWRCDKLPHELANMRVAALSSSGHVRGTHLRYVEGEGTFAFLEELGEPGHSGACVFANCPEGPTIVGTYYGLRSAMSRRHRRRACVTPVVALADMQRYVVDTSGTAAAVQVQAWQKGKIVKKKLTINASGPSYTEGGHEFSGVVCTLGGALPRPLLVGAKCCGSLSCGQPHRLAGHTASTG